jgi:hypothetical protein
MGILHLPLLLISVYGFVLSLNRFSSGEVTVLDSPIVAEIN